MSGDSDGTTRRGRPRSAAAGEAILTATLSLLAEGGFGGLTTDAIAARAGVSKATIYRRWNSKEAVVLAALETLASEVPTPDAGSLAGDLAELARGLVAVFSDEKTGGLVGAVVDQMTLSADFAATMRQGFLRARRAAALQVLERARERGELGRDTDLELAVDLLAAPFYYRVLITGAPVDQAFGAQVVYALLAWLEHPQDES